MILNAQPSGVRLIAGVLAVVAVACGLAACGGAHRHAATASTGSRPRATTPVSYGFGDAPGRFAQCSTGTANCCDIATAHCDINHTQGFFDNPLFVKLTSPLSAHRVRSVRLFVSYDAVSEWNGSARQPGCAPSRQDTQSWEAPAGYAVPAGYAIDQLLVELIEAHAAGLSPLVTITGYPQRFDRPPWDQPMPDPTTIAGSEGYRCGLRGILTAVDRLPAAVRPHVWEAINEPETFPIFNGTAPTVAAECTVGAHPQPDGPAKAACEQAIAERVIHGSSGHVHDTVIAGDFQHPYASYLGPYVTELSRQLPGAQFPATWSVHAYHEITAAYTGATPADLASFDTALAHDTGGRAHSLWITEAGTVLSSVTRTGSCPAVGVDAAGTLGACLDGNPARQAASASVFFKLPQAAHAVAITHLFWYQWTGGPGWDSGLLDASGVPRPVYCRFFGSGSCKGSPDAA